MRRLILLVAVSSVFLGCAQSRTTVTLADHVYTMYRADTAAEWEQGLGAVEQLATNEGMVFISPVAEPHTFWMKDVEYPIDIVWVNDGQVLGWITATPGNLTLYPSPGPVNLVLELPAGTATDIGLTVGDNVALDGY